MRPKLPPTWRIEVAEHEVARWRIPAQAYKLPAVDAEQACGFAVRHAHAAVGVPPWRPYVAESLAYATASCTGQVSQAARQLELPVAA